jgi:methyl-accepting chemotaxis protein
LLLKIKAIAGIVALVMAGVLAAESAYTVHVLRPKVLETTRTVADTASNLRDYARFQTDDLRSARNQKMIEHYFQLGEAGLLTLQKVNRTMIPQFTAAGTELTARLHALDPFETQLTRTASNAADLIESLRTDLVPRFVAIADALKTDIDDVADVVKSLNLSVKELTNLAANPDIPAIIAQFKEASQHFNSVTGHFDEASASFAEGMKKWPELMESIAKYMRASTKNQKWLYLAMIIRQLAAIPLRLP